MLLLLQVPEVTHDQAPYSLACSRTISVWGYGSKWSAGSREIVAKDTKSWKLCTQYECKMCWQALVQYWSTRSKFVDIPITSWHRVVSITSNNANNIMTLVFFCTHSKSWWRLYLKVNDHDTFFHPSHQSVRYGQPIIIDNYLSNLVTALSAKFACCRQGVFYLLAVMRYKNEIMGFVLFLGHWGRSRWVGHRETPANDYTRLHVCTL